MTRDRIFPLIDRPTLIDRDRDKEPKEIPSTARTWYDRLEKATHINRKSEIFKYLYDNEEKIFAIIESIYGALTLGDCGEINGAVARFIEKKFDVDAELVEGIVYLRYEDPVENSDKVYHQWIEIENEKGHNVYDFARAVFRTDEGKINSIITYEKPYFYDAKKWVETEKSKVLLNKLEDVDT